MSFLRRNVSTFFSNVASQRLSAVSSLTSSFWIFAGLGEKFYGDSIVSIVKRCKEICMVQLVGFDIFGSTVEAFATRNGLQRATHKWLPAGHSLGLLKLLRQNLIREITFYFLFTPQPSACCLERAHVRKALSSSVVSVTVLCFIISYEFNVFKVNPHDVRSDLGIGTLTCKSKTSKNCRLDRAISNMKLLWHPVTLSCNSR